MSLDLSPLNPSQREAVTAADGPTLIIAGPGTGKTFTLAYRLAYLISECGVNPEKILAVTFTRKAAQEMRERIMRLVRRQGAEGRRQKAEGRGQGSGVRNWREPETRNPKPGTQDPDSGLDICTFHSLGLTILREEGSRVGLLSGFRILSEAEQVELVKEILSEVMPQEPLNRARKWVRRISEKKNLTFVPPQPLLQVTVSQYHCEGVKRPKHSHNTLKDKEIAIRPRRTRNDKEGLQHSLQDEGDLPDVIFSTYENRLRALNLIDFDDLILKPLIIFQEHPHIRETYQNRFHYILVDEYQDINNTQYHFFKELCGANASLWVIGDADQAIYAFRGASVEYFLRFKQDYPGTRSVSLEKNYRSTETILSGAQAVISKNTHRIPYNLIPLTPGGLPINLFQASDHRSEARFVIKEIERLIGGIRMESSFEVLETFGFSEITILYRLHSLSYAFSEALREAGIPFQIVEGPSQSNSALDYLASYLRVVLNPHDDFSLRRILPLISKRFDFKTMAQLRRSAQENHCSLYSFIEHPEIGELLDYGQVMSLQRALTSVERFQQESHSLTLQELFKIISQELNLKELTEDEDHLERFFFTEPFSEEPACQQLPRFLEMISLLKEGETHNPNAEAVTLMTVHAAKGLEFPVVFMVGLESGILPCTEFGEEPGDPEEERRLFYVGMTRAKQRLYLSYSRNRYLFGENRNGTPSPFISEIPEEVMVTISDSRKPSKLKPKVKQRSLFS